MSYRKSQFRKGLRQRTAHRAEQPVRQARIPGLAHRAALLRKGTSGPAHSPVSSTARNASCGISTWPTCFIRFLPAACFAHSFRFRVMSPP